MIGCTTDMATISEVTRKWWEFAVVREGVLPLAISVIPFLVKKFFPGNDIAEVATLLLVPTGAALLRSAIASQQLRNAHLSEKSIARQFILAVAITLLFIYEGLATLFSFANDEPISAWICSFGFYFGYLIAIWFAFYPIRSAQASQDVLNSYDSQQRADKVSPMMLDNQSTWNKN